MHATAEARTIPRRRPSTLSAQRQLARGDDERRELAEEKCREAESYGYTLDSETAAQPNRGRRDDEHQRVEAHRDVRLSRCIQDRAVPGLQRSRH